jgi:hypothetical protein
MSAMARKGWAMKAQACSATLRAFTPDLKKLQGTRRYENWPKGVSKVLLLEAEMLETW